MPGRWSSNAYNPGGAAGGGGGAYPTPITGTDLNAPTPTTATVTGLGGFPLPTGITAADNDKALVYKHSGTPSYALEPRGNDRYGIKLLTPTSEARYTTIALALAAASSGDTVWVGPGVYTETGLTVPDGVIVTSPAALMLNAVAGSRFTLGNNATVEGFTLATPSDATYAITYGGVATARVLRCNFVGAAAASGACDNTGTGVLFCNEIVFTSGVADSAFAAHAGNIVLANTVVSEGTISSAVLASGGRVNLQTFGIGTGATVTDGLRCEANGVFTGSAVTLRATNCLHVTDNTAVVTLESVIFESTASDILGDATVTSASLRLSGCTLTEDKIDVSGSWRSSTNWSITYLDDKVGDRALRVEAELSVGTAPKGRESSFGGGDSFTKGVLLYTETAGGVFTDVSSSNGTGPIALPGTAANNALYVGVDRESATDFLKFPGIKVATTVAAVLGAGALVTEYWNGASWIDFATLSTESNGSYFPFGAAVLQRTGSEQVMFNQKIIPLWVKNDPPTTGTDRFWMRVRVATAITTSFTLTQVKAHTNRIELNEDGFITYYGSARPIKQFNWDYGNAEAANNSPTNSDVYIGDNLGVGRVENQFVDGATDRVGFNTYLPYNADTSTPAELVWSWFGEVGGVGNVEWTVRWGYSSDGDGVWEAPAFAPGTGVNEQSITFVSAGPAVNIQKTERVLLDMRDVIARRSGGEGDIFWVTIQRSGGAAADTYPSDVIAINLSGQYTAWSEGGHV